MNIISTAVRRMRAWLGAENSAQDAPTAINKTLAKPGTRELAALHAIRILQNNAWSTAIRGEIRRATNREIGGGAIAMSLQWLEEHGFVKFRESEFEMDERGGRRRRYYSLTEKGTEALRAG